MLADRDPRLCRTARNRDRAGAAAAWIDHTGCCRWAGLGSDGAATPGRARRHAAGARVGVPGRVAATFLAQLADRSKRRPARRTATGSYRRRRGDLGGGAVAWLGAGQAPQRIRLGHADAGSADVHRHIKRRERINAADGAGAAAGTGNRSRFRPVRAALGSHRNRLLRRAR